MDKEKKFNESEKSSFWRRALQGAGLATFFVFMILEMIVDIRATRWTTLSILMVPFSGALGGLLFYFLKPLRTKGRVYEILAYVINIIGFLLFLGFALYWV